MRRLPTQSVVHLALLINMLSLGSLMMVMPLGPDFVNALSMDAKNIGYISGGATFASAIAGFFAAPYLDRFNRKHALIVLLTLRFGLTAACMFATSQTHLFVLFILAGCVAGPASGVLMAAVIDVVPAKERGKRLGYVGMSFSLAAIIIMPLSLELAHRINWQAPFYLFGLGGLLLVWLVWWLFPSIPPQPRPQRENAPVSVLNGLLTSPLFLLGLTVVSLQMFGHFLLIPHFSNYFQFNLAFPRDDISLLYLYGGLASMVTMQLCGHLLDRGYASQTIVITTLLLAVTILCGFVFPFSLSLYLVFTLFMALSAARSSSTLAITAGIPLPHQRAAFMSYQGTSTNVASGLASIVSAAYLNTSDTGSIEGFSQLAIASTTFALVAMLLTMRLIPQLAERSRSMSARQSVPVTGQ
ncbi:putative MFS family arabinose efflux permease [Samsonia erythrinae]|uniref:Putative MFS family arabinose efflux permease n=2 Tax=Samsonia erythrinae TaxID=160434 RepID=A0A4R3VRP2_9GAMM|nr:putative MFS family arabinose efflux permease [Samsonia erythrinae]